MPIHNIPQRLMYNVSPELISSIRDAQKILSLAKPSHVIRIVIRAGLALLREDRDLFLEKASKYDSITPQ